VARPDVDLVAAEGPPPSPLNALRGQALVPHGRSAPRPKGDDRRCTCRRAQRHRSLGQALCHHVPLQNLTVALDQQENPEMANRQGLSHRCACLNKPTKHRAFLDSLIPLGSDLLCPCMSTTSWCSACLPWPCPFAGRGRPCTLQLTRVVFSSCIRLGGRCRSRRAARGHELLELFGVPSLPRRPWLRAVSCALLPAPGLTLLPAVAGLAPLSFLHLPPRRLWGGLGKRAVIRLGPSLVGPSAEGRRGPVVFGPEVGCGDLKNRTAFRLGPASGRSSAGG